MVKVVNKCTGNYVVLDSGSLITFDGRSDVKFEISFSSYTSLTIVLKFTTNPEEKQQTKKIIDKDKTKDPMLILEFINYDDVLEYTLKNPIPLCTYKGMKFYFNLWIHTSSVGDPLKKIDYTIYTEE